MSTTEKTPAAATQDLPADEAEIARKAVASTVCPVCFEQEEIRDLEEELNRSRAELSKVNRELTEALKDAKSSRAWSDEMELQCDLYRIAQELNLRLLDGEILMLASKTGEMTRAHAFHACLGTYAAPHVSAEVFINGMKHCRTITPDMHVQQVTLGETLEDVFAEVPREMKNADAQT